MRLWAVLLLNLIFVLVLSLVGAWWLEIDLFKSDSVNDVQQTNGNASQPPAPNITVENADAGQARSSEATCTDNAAAANTAPSAS